MSTNDIIDAVKQFTGTQWAAIIAIVGSGIYGFNWIENRYAQKDNVELAIEHIIRVDSKLTALINDGRTPEQIEKINQNAKLHEEQLRRYLESKNSK
jgi:hypothetical protein